MLLLVLALEELAGFRVAYLDAERVFQELAGQQTVPSSVALGLDSRLTRG